MVRDGAVLDHGCGHGRALPATRACDAELDLAQHVLHHGFIPLDRQAQVIAEVLSVRRLGIGTLALIVDVSCGSS